jgi:hypothetical protein
MRPDPHPESSSSLDLGCRYTACTNLELVLLPFVGDGEDKPVVAVLEIERSEHGHGLGVRCRVPPPPPRK